MPDQVDRAVAILAWGYMPTIRNRVRLRIPDEEVEEVAWDVLEGALKSAFDGDSTVQFRGTPKWRGTPTPGRSRPRRCQTCPTKSASSLAPAAC